MLSKLTSYAATNWFYISSTSTYSKQSLTHDIYACLKVMNQYLHYWGLKNFIGALAVYIQRYINRVGKLQPIHIFDIMFTGSLLVVKIWVDKAISNTEFAKIFEVPVSEMNLNELNFLKAIDYDFGLTSEDVNDFTKKFIKKNRRE
eukprot:TRINITY_DN23975_c0_g1_i1.p1 TRINITY_DN23975_c0_g1~~TRINITY_DN23975_c0_g1_i1.p1  ORF type:complete len:165 (-),score=19.10 TRINITY_DN23975_c0_g1_i1:55-492(-)